MSIDDLIDKEGWAKLSTDLDRLFRVAGCEPKCHIDGKEITIGDRFRLKPIARKGDEEASVMICNACGTEDKRIPRNDALKAIFNTNLEEEDFILGAVMRRPPTPSYLDSPHYYGRGSRFSGGFLVRKGSTFEIKGS